MAPGEVPLDLEITHNTYILVYPVPSLPVPDSEIDDYQMGTMNIDYSVYVSWNSNA